MKDNKEQRSYRPRKCTVKLIEVLAEQLGLRAQADVLDMWADDWVEKNGAPEGFGPWEFSEKKSGARREVFADDVPDDLLDAKKKPATVLGRFQAEKAKLISRVPGLKAGSELAISPVAKKGAHELQENGRIKVTDESLALQRGVRAPLAKRTGKLL